MLPLVVKNVVEEKKWLTPEEMVDCMAVSQTLPGAIIVNNSVFIGRKVAGLPGSAAAFLGAVLPSLICIIVVSLFLKQISDIPQVTGFFKGALAAAAGLVTVSCFRLGKGVIKKPGEWFIAIFAFAAVVFLNLSVLWVILGACMAGAALWLIRQHRGRKAR